MSGEGSVDTEGFQLGFQAVESGKNKHHLMNQLIFPPTRMHVHARSHACTHTHAHTHARTHTHARKQLSPC